MRLRDAVEFTPMTLRMAPEMLDAICMRLRLGETFLVIDAVMRERVDVKRVIGPTVIAVEDAVRRDATLDDGRGGGSGGGMSPTLCDLASDVSASGR